MAQFMAAAGSGDGVKQRQVVSLGAGFDTTWLHMKARHAVVLGMRSCLAA